MKNIQNKLILLLFITLAFPRLGASQDNLTAGIAYEVNKVYPYISATQEELIEAQRINDFKSKRNGVNMNYKPSWVREYLSVEVSACYKGEVKAAVGRNDVLTEEQKDIMGMADLGTNISIKVKYIPENTLTINEPKELSFTVVVTPENDAKYPGGKEQLKKYLKEKAIDKIPTNSFKGYDLVAIKFMVSAKGKIVNAHIVGTEYQAIKDEKINELLLETIRNMPRWTPAQYANGTTIKQDFVLTVGNMENCMTYLLNIRKFTE